MGKNDEELLLGLEKSDSDDAVEEFKLPPPRGRRKRNKMIPEARVAGGGSALVTWKCCFSFIVLSILISGGLVLAYFIYNMHIQLYILKDTLSKAKTDSDSNFDLYTKKIKEMELHHKSFDAFQNKHADSYEKLSLTIKDIVNKQNEQDKDGLVHSINTLENDVEAIKNDMARSGADFEKTQRYMLSMEDKFKKIQKDFNAIKLEAMNPTAPKSLSNDEDEDSNYMTKTQVNAMFKKFTDGQVDDQAASTKSTLAELANLKAQYKQVNVTHNSDLLRLTKDVVQIKRGFEAYKILYEPVITELKNATRDVFKQLDAHKADVTTLENEIKSINNTVTQMRTHSIFASFHPITNKNETTTPTQAAKQPTPSNVDKTITTIATTTKPTEFPLTSKAHSKGKSLSTIATQPAPKSPSTASVSQSTMKQNGPVLPDESSMHKTYPTQASSSSMPTTHPETPTAHQATPTAHTSIPTAHWLTPSAHHPATGTTSKTTHTPPHVYSALPKTVKEQTAKNESETDYKQFQSTGNTDTSSGVTGRRLLPSTDDSYQQNEDYSRPGTNYEGPDGNYKPPDNGANAEDVMRMIQNSAGTGHLSDAQKQELVQKFLTAQENRYPYNSGDKKK